MSYEEILEYKKIDTNIVRQGYIIDDSIPRKTIFNIFCAYPYMWHSRYSILQKTGHGEVRIDRIIKALVNEGVVEKSHSGRRTIYRLTPSVKNTDFEQGNDKGES